MEDVKHINVTSYTSTETVNYIYYAMPKFERFDDFADYGLKLTAGDNIDIIHKRRKEALSNMILFQNTQVLDKYYYSLSDFLKAMRDDIDILNDTRSDFINAKDESFGIFSYTAVGIMTDYNGIIEIEPKPYTKDMKKCYSNKISNDFILSLEDMEVNEFIDRYASAHEHDTFRFENFVSILFESRCCTYPNYTALKYNQPNSRMIGYVRYSYKFREGENYNGYH